MQILTKGKQGCYTNINQFSIKKKVTRQREGHYILIKGSIQQDDVKHTIIYRPQKCIK